MQALFTFGRTFIKSLTSLPYYADIVRAKTSFSLKYFFFFNILFSLIVVAKFLVPVMSFDVKGMVDETTKLYPMDLQVSVSNGRVSINKPLPYAVPVPGELRDTTQYEYTYDAQTPRAAEPVLNFVVFDSEKNMAAIKDFDKYQTYVLVTETAVYYRADSSRNEIRAYPIPADAEPFSFGPNEVNELKNTFLNTPFIQKKLYIPVIAVVLFVFVVPFMILVRLWTAFVYSVVMFFFASILKSALFSNYKFTLGKIFQVSLHSLTFVIVVKFALESLAPISTIQMVNLHNLNYFLAYAVFTGLALWQASKILTRTGTTTQAAAPSVAKSKKTTKTKK